MRVSSFDSHTKLAGVRQSVYAGQDRLGDIIQQDREFIARDRLGNPIGTFNSLRAAANAVAKAAGEP